MHTNTHRYATSAIATFVGAVASTRCPQLASMISSRAIVVVFPVPGGPCAVAIYITVASVLPKCCVQQHAQEQGKRQTHGLRCVHHQWRL